MARSSLPLPLMGRVPLLAGLALIGVVTWGLIWMARAPGRGADLALGDPAPAVQVQHQLVTADIITETVTSSTSGTSGATPSAVRRAAPARRSQPSRPTTLLDRAKRAFMGDGSHRPEPFPRAKQE